MRFRCMLLIIMFAVVSTMQAQNPLFNRSGHGSSATGTQDTLLVNSNEQVSSIARLKYKLLQWQQQVYRQLYHQKNSTATLRGIMYALLLVFVYGFLHALGPGHGKLFISGYFLASQSRVGKGIIGGFAVGMLHAIAALILVFSLHFLFNSSITRSSDSIRSQFQIVSFSVLLLVGIYMLWKSIRSSSHSHENKSFWGLVLSVGLVPCPGAVMIAIYGISVLNSLVLTILLILTMGVGMSLAISIFAVTPVLMHKIKHPLTQSPLLWKTLSISGSLIIIAFATIYLFTLI
ncbi:MAG: hypothetical protein K8S56_01360 [Candidatus Cloacimonetes bacterium]|nr:hypothetical protein [Candidatus Cloacimonadota bacterium]